MDSSNPNSKKVNMIERMFKKQRTKTSHPCEMSPIENQSIPTIPNEHPSPSPSPIPTSTEFSPSSSRPTINVSPSSQPSSDFDINSLESDPALRKRILEYPPNLRDQVRRVYLQRGPCQPMMNEFPITEVGGAKRRFNSSSYQKYGSWIEYSEKANAVFCLCCYLFKNETGNAAGGDAFVNGGFCSWNKMKRCDRHVGGPKSAHNQAFKKCISLMNQTHSIQTAFDKQSEQAKRDYRTRLIATIDTLRFLIRQGIGTRGHDESEESNNRGNFLELLMWYAERNKEVGDVVLKNAPGNNLLTAPSIQKDVINACAKETTKNILEDLGDENFSILVDESSDISQKERMALCLRYVDKSGKVTERFLGLVHVSDTTALSLQSSIYSLLSEHSLSPSRIRGQGYDGASNMKGEINGLKTLIMRENPSAYYVHCFAHQLQLTLVAVSSKNDDCVWLFETLTNLLNVIGVSCKRREMLREKQAEKVMEALSLGEIESGSGLNQEMGLKRPADTRWGTHYKTLLNVYTLFPSIIDVLGTLGEISSNSADRIKAETIAYTLRTFPFVFMAQLMLDIFGVTHDLNLALQRKDQDIINALSLVNSTKEQLQKMRDEGWQSLMDKVSSFCVKNDIQILNMNDDYVPLGRYKRGLIRVSNMHHFRVEVFLKVIDLQLQELNNRFDEINTELLTCMACLSPKNSFANFDKNKLVRLAEFYPNEFSSVDLLTLKYQLENFIHNIRKDVRFSNLNELGELSMKLVETGKHIVFPQVYLLLKLVLILPVATASVERAFSSMNYVKSKVRNSMGDQLLNDALVTYIERDIFSQVTNDAIIDRFQNMRTRRGQL